ncbi:malto-oligosyltrehalose synthase [Nakamurella antarctica]|uniref:Malto-oligosyltrehalose synthase n=1 Tax=Nakamurella antarctica TaxID=1902245 RepID=A0A3G8ZLC7_9ACTN|nr:malto-oligosyltrehalose synthase [Nakamurella antarctica]AZI57958.1 malto-oligosyltrehalose synthase [Nakamurella antarctica]
MRTPKSTYRLQISPRFTLQHAADHVDYLSNLGADWAYLSPVLQSERGSDHGYDVTDHSLTDEQRGGPEGLKVLSDTAHQHAMGVLVDIVPNHVGVASPAQSKWWWDLLLRGQESAYALAFDVDWDFGNGRVRVPILGDGPDELAALTISDGLLHYYDHVLPIAEGTGSGTAQQVHERQHYELVSWRRADAELNYRRFFAVSTLAGIRVEVPAVFAESHAEILRWVHSELADGLRIDHPDGLYDPAAYLDELAAATGGMYVLVEKILEGEEPLPTDWKCAGTTGYDVLALIDRVFVDEAGEAELTRVDRELRGAEADWKTLIHQTKRGIADGILRSEVVRLARLVQAHSPSIADPADALAELLTCFPVYRSYLTQPAGSGAPRRKTADAARDGADLQCALDLALLYRPDIADALHAVASLLADPTLEVSRRFQQTSGMVMAKGVEDTAFYQFTRLTSLTEVGADPDEFSIDVADFHRRQANRHAEWPASMVTLSTHDTKRSEDVRARLNVLAEIPEQWSAAVSTWRQQLADFDLVMADGPLVNLLWQAVVGAWPISRERMHAYAEKASREAGNSTNWWHPNEAFEDQMHGMLDAIFDDLAVRRTFEEVVEKLTAPGWSNSLAAKLVSITGPGVPDVYQGTELWDYSLVDPDNRRLVDYDQRRALLAKINDGFVPAVDQSGAAKMLVTASALRLRRDSPELFNSYQPLYASGSAAKHVLAFDRGGAVTVATRLPVGLQGAGGWHESVLALPEADGYLDVLTNRFFTAGVVPVPLSDLLAQYPVALLIPAEGPALDVA